MSSIDVAVVIAVFVSFLFFSLILGKGKTELNTSKVDKILTGI